MTEIDPVTAFRAYCPHVPWEAGELETEEYATRLADASLDAWLTAARDRGLNVTVLERFTPRRSKFTFAVVEVNGKRYNVDRHGRGSDVEAIPLP